MAANVIVDAGFVVALLTDRDSNHHWAHAISERFPPPWITCEAVVSEAIYLLGPHGAPALIELIRRGAIITEFQFEDQAQEVIALLQKYSSVPMSFADACLVRMSEMISRPV